MSEMTEQPGNLLERGASIVRSLNLTNVLIVALLVIVAVPSYFAYRFMTDAAFRGEFMSSAIILEKFAPCVVLEGHRYGSITRHSILKIYGFDERMEKIIGLRAPGTLTEVELGEACKKVVAAANEIKKGERHE
jgi:hypothetical protein